VSRRIFGTESEYAPMVYRTDRDVGIKKGASTVLDQQEKISARLMAGAAILGIPMAGEFLGNGGRLYVDRGGHPEYATPECGSVNELVAHEIAGDRMVQKLAESVQLRDGSARLHVFKNNVDLYGHTYGGHENYLVSARGMNAISCLIPFLVTRQIYTGAGKVMTRERDGVFGFQISQRADFFDRTYSDRTSEVRGIINVRKREISRADQGQRLHLIIGDSNMAQHSIGLKIGTLALMLQLLESGALENDFELLSPSDALKSVSRDLNAGIACSLRGRCRDHSALEIQSMYLEKALRYYSANPPGKEETYWLRTWEETLSGLKEVNVCLPGMVLEHDGGDLRRRIDWIFKLWLLDRSRSKGADPEKLKTLDLKYHDLNPASGLYLRCLELDLVDRLISESAIVAARHHPPRNTRAYLRGMVVQEAFQTNVVAEVENWERIRVRARIAGPDTQHCFNRVRRERNSLRISLEDPFRSEDPCAMKELREFIEKWG
jgi:proteasome accessory factor A